MLYISVHRQEHAPGVFYPEGGGADRVGAGAGEGGGGGGEGFNVNVACPFKAGGFGDADYRALFAAVVLPLAREFRPEMVFVAAGFDACAGDPVGGYNVSPELFGELTADLAAATGESAGGRLVMALEGGYNCAQLGACVGECVRALLRDSSARCGGGGGGGGGGAAGDEERLLGRQLGSAAEGLAPGGGAVGGAGGGSDRLARLADLRIPRSDIHLTSKVAVGSTGQVYKGKYNGMTIAVKV